MTRLAHFELHLDAIDAPTDRMRWNGKPMASEEADAALHEATEAFQEVVRKHGLTVAHTGYGVTASEG